MSAHIEALSARIDGLIAAMPGAQAPVDPDTAEIRGPDAPLGVIGRLDEVTGIGRVAAQAIVAEVGLDMGQFTSPGHVVSRAKLTPRTVQSGPKSRGAKTGKGNRYLKRVLGEAAAGAIGTDTFLGARHRRLVKRTGKLKALVATERSILVIVWHLLSDPSVRFIDLGSDFYERRIDTDRKTRDLGHQLTALGHQLTALGHQLTALGHQVTLTPAA